MRYLIPSAVGGAAPVGVEQSVEVLDRVPLGGIAQQLQVDRGKGAVEVIGVPKRPSDIRTTPKRFSSGIWSPESIA